MTAPEPTPTAEHIDAVAERQAGAANALWNQANLVGQAIDQGRLDGTSGAAVAAAIRATTPREFARACSEATAPDPTAEHIDAVARAVCASEFATGFGASEWDETITNRDWYRDNARAILTSTDAAVHAALAASLPAEVKIASLTDAEMLAALVRAGVLTAETARPCACPAEERSPWGGLVESASNCAYCAAAPEAGPCSLHREAQR